MPDLQFYAQADSIWLTVLSVDFADRVYRKTGICKFICLNHQNTRNFRLHQ